MAEIHVVTGKGGAGKSTVSVALALALAAGGRRVLLADVEGRRPAVAPLGLAGLPEQPEQIAHADGGGVVWGCAQPAEAVLEGYLRTNVASAVAVAAARRFGVTDFATSIAPGLKDVLQSGFVVHEAQSGGWDAVVVDAPPTGRVGRFLDVTRALTDIATSGPIHRQAQDTARFLRSEYTQVHLVTLAEQLPVEETLEAVAELGGMGLRLGHVVVNQVLSDAVGDAARYAAAHHEAAAAAASARLGAEVVAGLFDELADVSARSEQERVALAALDAGWSGPVVHLPAKTGGVSTEDLYDLVDDLGPLGGQR
ncbi:ArsA-related P-loop ATPase [Corynebacterium sp. TAE3-ERU12]|uniref:ArsA-related P-loop ATPase n=1 Tax=Corynebacterium sp. TAE3-ERU12 TaxID=2849491 RepID=UPI00351D8034